MELKREFAIPRIYSGVARTEYAVNMNKQQGIQLYHTHYHHIHCRHDFWLDDGRGSYYGELPSISCPFCGERLEIINKLDNMFTGTPSQVSFKLFELKERVLLRIKYRLVKLNYDIESQKKHSEYKYTHEEIDFNIRTGDCRFTQFLSGTKIIHGINNPFATEFADKTLLKYLNSHNYTQAYYKEINRFLADIRNLVSKKFKQIHGYDLKRLYVSKVDDLGYFIYPILNIAYRLKCVDAKNLPSVICQQYCYGNAIFKAREFADRKGFTSADLNVLQEFFSGPVKGNCVQRLLSLFKVDNTAYNRKVLQEDLYQVKALQLAQKLTDNVDYRQQFYKFCVNAQSKYYTVVSFEQAFEFLNQLKSVGFTDKNLISYIKSVDRHRDKNIFSDTIRILENLERENVNIAEIELKPNAQFVHDKLFQTLDRIRNKDFNLDVSETIKKRLSMQYDRIKFFLPNTAWELKKTGNILHNCVGSYANCVKKGDCQIVLMSDIVGNLIACIEIKDNVVLQAKLNFNKPVSENETVQKAIINWCNETGLKIYTGDIIQQDDTVTA